MGNFNSGRRKATALKILQGNPGKNRLPVDLRPPVGEVVKPATLSPSASVVWEEMAPICLYMGTLTPADVKAFALLCEMQSDCQAVIKLKGTKAYKPFRLLQFARDLRPYYALFGLDPASRSRIHLRQPDEPRAKFAGALK
jgi:phage terminase small subunit